MRNRGQFIFGALLVLLGLMFLFGTVFQIDLWPFCWSFGLIGAGVWLVLRPRLVEPGTGIELTVIGDIKRRGEWAVHNEEFWLGVGDIELDLREAALPSGETSWRFYTFVGDIEIIVPREMGIAVHGMGVFVDSELLGQKHETFFSPVDMVSDDYATAGSRLRIDVVGFVSEIKVRQF